VTLKGEKTNDVLGAPEFPTGSEETLEHTALHFCRAPYTAYRESWSWLSAKLV